MLLSVGQSQFNDYQFVIEQYLVVVLTDLLYCLTSEFLLYFLLYTGIHTTPDAQQIL